MLTFGLSTTFSRPKTGPGGKNYRPVASLLAMTVYTINVCALSRND
jgi:hypothetical protein